MPPQTSTDLINEVNALKHKVKEQENIILNHQAELDKANKLIDNYKSNLLQCFSPTQLNSLLNDEKIKVWPEGDIISALTLHSLGANSYKYLRKHMNFPFPSVSTINRRISSINIEPGILKSVIRLMKVKGQTLSKGEKACIISFDEMKVDHKFAYDRIADKIYKPHNYVQCVIARGIIGNWKQPIFYNFDCRMSKNILFDIISQLEDCGYPVHATVCDLGGSNIGLLRDLGITVENPNFLNPHDTSRSIHIFADPPHLLKLIRNNVLDHSLDTSLGVVCKAPLVDLINYQSGDFKLAHKLSEHHLNVKGADRQRVKTAAQLLSQTTSKALLYLGNNKIFEKSNNWESTSKFICIIDQWFDLMNSSSFTTDKAMRSAFRSTKIHSDVLENIVKLFDSIKISGKVFPFIKGVLYSSRSLVNLFSDLKHDYGVQYILTNRLNQDVLENTFGILRQMGSGHCHPDPVAFKYRMRRYILSKKHVLVSVHPNTCLAGKQDILAAEGINSFTKNSSPINKKELYVDPEVLLTAAFDIEEEEHIDDFQLPTNEIDGFSYVQGFIVNKFKHKYSFLASTELHHDNDWIAAMDRGGLNRVKPDIMNDFLAAESVFRNHHADSLLEECAAVSKLVCKAKDAGVCFPQDLLEYFFRCRIYFKIRRLNKELSIFKSRKYCNKMKKIIN